MPFPFAAIVGQDEAKLAALLAAINPRAGGLLLSGPKGIGKTSIVRGVADLLPMQRRAACAYGCDPQSPGGLCEACAAGRTTGKPRNVRAEIVELPVNAQIDDVVGTLDLQAALERGNVAFRPGLLASANRALLYVDEINLLGDAVVDVLLDAAAQGVVHVKRGQQTVDYPSRFTLVGTMNPEEGELRPQITDRIGLRVFVTPAASDAERLEIYRRNAAFARDPHAFRDSYAFKTRSLRARVAKAIDALPAVAPDEEAERFAVATVGRLGIESHRTEFVALEAACALAAFDGRPVATAGDVRRVFAMAARLRRSRLRAQARNEYLAEDAAIAAAVEAGERADAADDDDDAPPQSGLIVAPDFSERERSRAKPQRDREGSALGAAPLRGGRLDVPATALSAGVAARAPVTPEAKESVDAATPLRLTVFVVDASLSAADAARAVSAATQELLRPIYAERERAALVACWGPAAEVVVDERAGRNVELVAAWLAELGERDARALTPLPDALEHARRMAERFRRANAGAEVRVAVFSDGRANVPLGGEAELAQALLGDGDARGLAESAAEQCRTLAARFAGRAETTFVNLDEYETSRLMRELAELSGGRYFALNDVVARVG